MTVGACTATCMTFGPPKHRGEPRGRLDCPRAAMERRTVGRPTGMSVSRILTVVRRSDASLTYVVPALQLAVRRACSAPREHAKPAHQCFPPSLVPRLSQRFERSKASYRGIVDVVVGFASRAQSRRRQLDEAVASPCGGHREPRRSATGVARWPPGRG